MSDTLTDRIDALLAKARAAKGDAPVTVWWSKAQLTRLLGAPLTPMERPMERDAAHIAANDPATIEALCAVAKADNPEPLDSPCVNGWYPLGETDQHIAWRKRQELKAALYDALGKE